MANYITESLYYIILIVPRLNAKELRKSKPTNEDLAIVKRKNSDQIDNSGIGFFIDNEEDPTTPTVEELLGTDVNRQMENVLVNI